LKPTANISKSVQPWDEDGFKTLLEDGPDAARSVARATPDSARV
jgi:hypothetical protein